MESAPVWISQYGYAALFLLLVLGIVGLPIPDETLLAFAGYLVFKGVLAWVPTVLTGFLGSVCGITVSYALGGSVGAYSVDRFGPWLRIKQAHMEQARKWFIHRGRLLLVFGYFIPGVRHLTAFVAGASRLSWKEFALFAYSGALLWSVTFITLGYVLEERWNRLSHTVHRIVLVIIVVFCVAAASYLLIRRTRRHS
jgi:membrane protein DedA with SNARE-associated domain